MIAAIQHMTHYIRTAFGDSDDSYGPIFPPDSPYMGLLQGNGAAGGGWTGISTVIIEAMRSLGFGYESWSAISRDVIKLVCSAFVDDTDLVHSGADNLTDGATLIVEMQNVLDHWDGMLRATGGALKKSKSYWYLLDYERRNGRWNYKSIESLPGNISLFNDETLGCWGVLCPHVLRTECDRKDRQPDTSVYATTHSDRIDWASHGHVEQ
jgi:hypothetical protein